MGACMKYGAVGCLRWSVLFATFLQAGCGEQHTAERVVQRFVDAHSGAEDEATFDMLVRREKDAWEAGMRTAPGDNFRYSARTRYGTMRRALWGETKAPTKILSIEHRDQHLAVAKVLCGSRVFTINVVREEGEWRLAFDE